MKEMVQFENDLILLAKNLQFKKECNDFQKRLKSDMKAMQESGKTLTPADKTTNMYRLSPEEYSRLKHNAVTSKYKKASTKIKENAEKSSVKLVKKAGVLERMSKNGSNQCCRRESSHPHLLTSITLPEIEKKQDVLKASKTVCNLSRRHNRRSWLQKTTQIINHFRQKP